MKLLLENWRKFKEESLNEIGPSGEGLPRVPSATNVGKFEKTAIEAEIARQAEFEEIAADSIEQAKQWYEPGGQRHESWMNFLTPQVGEEEATRIYDEHVLPRIHQRLEGVEIYRAGDPEATTTLDPGVAGHFASWGGPEGEIVLKDLPRWMTFGKNWIKGALPHEIGHGLERASYDAVPGAGKRGEPVGEDEVFVDSLEDFHSLIRSARTGETFKPVAYGMYEDELAPWAYTTNDRYEKVKGKPFPGTWVRIIPGQPDDEFKKREALNPREHNKRVLQMLFPDMPETYRGGPGIYARGEESNPLWHVVGGEVITDIYNLGLLDKEKVEDLMSAAPGADTIFGDPRAPWKSQQEYIPDDLLRALKYYKNPDLTTDEVLKLLKSIVKVDPAQKRKGRKYQPAAKGREVVVEQKEELQLIFENWRNYLNEGIDPEIIEHIRKTIEERVEIPVSKMFLLENSTVLAHLQVDLNEHSSELMPLIHERWESSDELKQIKEMGYDVRLGVMGESIDASSVPLTKELL